MVWRVEPEAFGGLRRTIDFADFRLGTPLHLCAYRIKKAKIKNMNN